MGVFDRQIATAKRLIAKNGQLVTWRKVAAPVDDDPANPTNGVITDAQVRIVFFPNQQINLLSTLSMLKGTEVPGGKLYGLMGAVDFDPQLVDTIVGTAYGDLGLSDKNGIDRLAPNGETILYTLRFTR